MRKLYSAEKLENGAALQYNEVTRRAFQQQALLDESDPQVQRVRKIMEALVPHSYKFNDRAKTWAWEVNVIRSKMVNAFCMPGGKIAVFTGIIDQLKLSDDEIAMIMGHEIAHALARTCPRARGQIDADKRRRGGRQYFCRRQCR